MPSNDEPCLVCVRVEDARTGDAAPGSSEDTCADCGASVLVAPSGAAFVAAHGVRVVCSTCVIPKITEETPMSTVPGAMAELEASLSPEDFARVRRVMDLLGIEASE